MRIYFGSCQITVTGVSALYPQRVVVRIKNGGDVIVPGVAGETHRVEAEQWELLLQHQVDGAWQENIRAIAGKWTPHGEAQRQVIRSKDRDWPTDRIERNLVVTLERGGPVAARRLDAPRLLADPHAVSTQSSDMTARTGARPAIRTQGGGALPAASASARTPGASAESAESGAGAAQRSQQTATSSDGYVW